MSGLAAVHTDSTGVACGHAGAVGWQSSPTPPVHGSAKHGLLRWQFDLSYQIIACLAALGLAYDIELPCEEEIQRHFLDIFEPTCG